MPRGYRSIVLAGLGWLILAAAPEGNGAHRQQGDSQRAVADSLRTIARASVEAIKPAPASKHDRPCRKGEDDRESELCAEWQSADQAHEASKWAARSFWVGLAGIAGLLYSLYLTRRATKVAVEATEDADRALAISERNADAAAEQVRISTETSHRDLRAYLTTTHVRMRTWRTDNGTVFHRMRATVRNNGRTSAYVTQNRFKVVSSVASVRAVSTNKRVITPQSEAVFTIEGGAGVDVNVFYVRDVCARFFLEYTDYLGNQHSEDSFWTPTEPQIPISGVGETIDLTCGHQIDETVGRYISPEDEEWDQKQVDEAMRKLAEYQKDEARG